MTAPDHIAPAYEHFFNRLVRAPCATRPDRDVAYSGQPPHVLKSLWWQFGQSPESLAISAIAFSVLVAVDLIQPGHMELWQILGGIPLYMAGVLICFRIERWGHRRRRARLPVDMSGGGRFALLLAALALCYVGDVDTHGHAGWLAYAAIVLGSMSDGAWTALVATRQRTGFWRAFHELARNGRDAQRRSWDALVGQEEPSPPKRPTEASIPASDPPHPTQPGQSKHAETRQPSRGYPQ